MIVGGRVGILACRNIDQNNLFMKRCADTFEDDWGLILPVTDEDLKVALRFFSEQGTDALESILLGKHETIVFTK